MSMLFDTSPVDDPVKRKGARGRTAANAPAAEPEPVVAAPPRPRRPVALLGKIDDVFVCADSRCQSKCHDICVEDGHEWLIQCAFCGTAQWVRAVKGHLTPREEQFTFRDGRFEGLTVDEAATQPRGRDYIAWAAREHKRPAVRAACKTWLDTQAARP